MASRRFRCRRFTRRRRWASVLRACASPRTKPRSTRQSSACTRCRRWRMRDLRISLVQGATRWHDPAGNRDYYGRLIAPLHGVTDLILLPETFTSGFSNEAIHNAETMEGPTVAWMRDRSRALDAAIVGSVQIRDGDGVYNRLLFVTPDGALQQYDKRHLFRYAKEHERYAAGSARLTVEWKGWR